MNGYAGSAAAAYSALSPIHNGPSAATAGTLIPLGATFPAVCARMGASLDCGLGCTPALSVTHKTFTFISILQTVLHR